MKNSTEAAPELVDVYVYRTANAGGTEFLLLQRAPGVIYAGQWRMVGGKIKAGETAAQAALRELQEETGCLPEVLWCVPAVNSFFDFKRNKLHHIPVFAVLLNADAEIRLNHEHSAYSWFSANTAAAQVQWPEQQRMLRLIPELLHNTHGRLPREWIVDRHDAASSS